MHGLVCAVCGTSVAPGSTFCGTCGAAQPQQPVAAQGQAIYQSPHQRQVVSGQTPFAQAFYVAPPGAQYYHPAQQPIVVRAQVGGADACPRCYTVGMASNKYTVWHFLIAIFWFPLGLLAFLAPVKRCVCGNEFGLGVAFVRFMQIMLAITIGAVVLIVIALGSR